MARSLATQTILEKAAVDNGFGRFDGDEDGWLIWGAHAAPARLCLTETESGYGIGSDHFGAMRGLDTHSASDSTPPPGFRAVQVEDSSMLSAAAGVIRRLADSLPDEPLRQFRKRLRELPSKTEVERLHKERVGQDVFREALMLFWDKACAVTGLRHPDLLRASHIVRWADCKTDAERLNVHNGLLLAANLDAAFDAHLISFDADGRIQFSSKLSREDIAVLGLTPEMRLRRTDPEIEHRLAIHRNKMTGEDAC